MAVGASQRDFGPGAAVDGAAIVAIYDAVVKVADATGIPIEDYKADLTVDIRDTLGINDFPSSGLAGGNPDGTRD